MSGNGEKKPLRICLAGYRSNPYSGGQGVYIRHLSSALKYLGHKVDVISGPPYPVLDDDINLTKLESLDLYNAENLFRIPSIKELSDPINFCEWIGVSTQGFSEPFTFGLRLYKHLRGKLDNYDIIHDNQGISYGLWGLKRFIPATTTIHHPITRDRVIDVRAALSVTRKLKHVRWYSFIGMQKKVARSFSHIITVSKCAQKDISKDFKIPLNKFRVIPNGIDTKLFCPGPSIRRVKNRIIVTNSSDTPLKGLKYLLMAIAEISMTRSVKLIVIGSPKKNGKIVKLIKDLDIGRIVTFTGRIDEDEFVRQYSKASIAVIPSMYEGFGLPAGEAMACAVPVISTTGGALPEVVGDAGILVPPADSKALAKAIISIMDNPALSRMLGEAGYKRVHECFTWKKAAKRTAKVYREVIDDYSRL